MPFHWPTKVEADLEILKLEELDIMEPAMGPTPWASPIVATPKPNDPEELHVSVDMRKAKKAVKLERHMMPTVEDTIADLNKVFSIWDMNKSHHQLQSWRRNHAI